MSFHRLVMLAINVRRPSLRIFTCRKKIDGMDELDLGGVPPPLQVDYRSDAIFDASLILELQRHGLTSYLPNRAAPAGAGEEDEDEQPATDDVRGALVVGMFVGPHTSPWWTGPEEPGAPSPSAWLERRRTLD